MDPHLSLHFYDGVVKCFSKVVDLRSSESKVPEIRGPRRRHELGTSGVCRRTMGRLLPVYWLNGIEGCRPQPRLPIGRPGPSSGRPRSLIGGLGIVVKGLWKIMDPEAIAMKGEGATFR
uniref:Uncharacterized protein n=1 Tax=Hyaloperonospora arabidopsidis (strain Emoy2) TaxID=559515 RepID=M4B1T9_HYAAE